MLVVPFLRPEVAEPNCSLAISGGLGGARLTHNHERQYHYVLQSLTLWREISHEVGAPSPSVHAPVGPRKYCKDPRLQQ